MCVGVCPRAPKTPLLANLSSPLRLSMLRHNARAPAEAGGLIHWYFAVYTWVVTPHVKFIFYPEMKSERGNSQTSCLATVPCRVSFENVTTTTLCVCPNANEVCPRNENEKEISESSPGGGVGNVPCWCPLQTPLASVLSAPPRKINNSPLKNKRIDVSPWWCRSSGVFRRRCPSQIMLPLPEVRERSVYSVSSCFL